MFNDFFESILPEILPFIILYIVAFSFAFIVLPISFVIRIVFLLKKNKFFKTATLVTGEIVGVCQEKKLFGAMRYAPIVEFEYNGEKRRFQDTVFSSEEPIKGAKVIVGINPKNPYEVRIHPFIQM